MRKHLAELINRVELKNEQFVITKFGQPKAVLVPLEAVPELQSSKKRQARFTKSLKEAAGMWREREDMADPAAWVTKQRQSRFSFSDEDQTKV